jgi:hypothetical protein
MKALADRADNRDGWMVWLTVLLALYAYVDLFVR